MECLYCHKGKALIRVKLLDCEASPKRAWVCPPCLDKRIAGIVEQLISETRTT